MESVDLAIKNKFIVTLMVLWNRIPRGVVDAYHQKHSKVRLNGALSNLVFLPVSGWMD